MVGIALMSPIRLSHRGLAPHQFAPMLGAHSRIRSRLRAIYPFSLGFTGGCCDGLDFKALTEAIQEAYVQGVSTHAGNDLV